MSLSEETIAATLDSNGQLQLMHVPRLPAGPVQVTIRVAAATNPTPGLADVVREIAAEQRGRCFSGRSSAEIHADDDLRQVEDTERDSELEAARRKSWN